MEKKPSVSYHDNLTLSINHVTLGYLDCLKAMDRTDSEQSFIMFLLRAVLVLAVCSITLLNAECPDDWHFSPISMTCFKFSTKPMTWSNARKACESMESELAFLRNEMEIMFMKGLRKHLGKYKFIRLIVGKLRVLSDSLCN